MKDKQAATELERVPTGVPGLDDILRGGFLRGGTYIIEGVPGAGKTILANQICFDHVAQRGCVVFATLLAESHARMLQHLRPMSFFDESAIPDRLYYVSAFSTLETDGLKGIIDLIRREIKGHKATLFVLDGFSSVEESASSEREFKKFVHDIQSHAAASDCTMLLLTNGSNRAIRPENTMVDGLIYLDEVLLAQRTERMLQVRKFRGSGILRGSHPFRITNDGVTVFPRIEAAFAMPSAKDVYQLRRISIGVEGLDRMLTGGVMAETSTGLYGPTGSGKTTLGLQFMGLSSEAEPGLFVGFFESPERLRVKAEQLGVDLRTLEKRGVVELLWRPQGEHILDELGHLIITAVRHRNVKRLFVDGYGGLVQSAVHPERITRFISTMSNEVRALNATLIFAIESREILGAKMELPADGLSSLLEGLIVMRYAEIDGRLLRLVSITKQRDSDFDPFLREYQITARGISVGETFTGLEAILSGYGREPKAVATRPSRKTSNRKA